MSSQSDLIKEAVRDWFSREGIKVETIKNPKAEFLFKVKFLRFVFTVVRPNDQRYLQIESQIMISPQHQKLLTVDKMRDFQMKAMKFSFQEGFNMGFVQPRPGQPGPQPPGPGFVVSDRIYDDAFTEDQLWRNMRKLHGAIDMIIAILNETTGQPGTKIDTTKDTGPSYYT
ncbi:MAG: DUF2299 family protein [Candidatus Thorarchaeota archaeon]